MRTEADSHRHHRCKPNSNEDTSWPTRHHEQRGLKKPPPKRGNAISLQLDAVLAVLAVLAVIAAVAAVAVVARWLLG
eukprot:9094558-Alexandrium_andersonii.AAC.1